MAADFTIRGDTKLDGSGFSEGLSRMGNLAAKGLKVVGASLAAAGVAVGALAKQSLDAYSDYEQMVGGVKTLFGTEADSVEEYAASVGKSVGEVQGEYDALVAAQNKVFADAKNAYKDAGMSANAYMQTVTSFSARLLQGLGGDSQKAAEIANMAVVDMSDNVNKMGSSMTDVQNAYQGFAKQNYTMLDNLKLGYGGTQAEMARLINDSGVLGDTMTVTAETVNNVSFDKIIEAIHTIQTEMGITGTTAKEASTTIAGSVSQMSAAWTNWLTALADPSQDLSQLTTALLDSIVNVGKNVVPRLMEILPALGSGLVSLASGLAGYIPGAVQQVVADITAAAPQMLTAAQALVTGFATAVTTQLPTLLQSGVQLVQQLVNGAVQALPGITSVATQLLGQFASSFATGYAQLLSAGAQIIGQVVSGVVQSLPSLITIAGTVITQFLSALIAAAPQVLQSGVQMILQVVQGIVSSLPQIISSAASVIAQFLAGIGQQLPQLLQSGITMIAQLVAGLIQAIPQLIASIPQIISGIVNAFASYDWMSIGGNIIQGIANGIASGVGVIIDAAKSAASAALNAAKEFLGIASPSKVMRDQVGRFIPEGMAVGVTKYTDPALRSVQDMAQRMVQAGQAATAQMQARTASGYARASSGSASVETAPVTQSHTQYIYFEQPMQAPDEIARALRIQQTYGLAGAR